MAYFDNPQITKVGVPDDNSPSSLAFPSPSLDTSPSYSERRTRRRAGCSGRQCFPASPSPSTDNHLDNHGHPSHPTPILRSTRISLDAFGSSSHTSDLSHPHHPSLAHSSPSRWAANSIESRDSNQSYYVPLPHSHGHRRKRGNNSTERDAKYNSLSPLRSAHSDVTNALPSTGPPILTWKQVQTQSRPSAVTGFFRRTVRRVRRSSSSPSGKTDTGSDPTRNDGHKGGQNGEAKKQSAVLDNLEERMKAANKLHGEAVALHMLYESGTVATMKDLRATGLPRPLPQDNALFCEVDLVLAEVGRSYERLMNFWKEEICRVAEALKNGRIDPRDFQRWSNIHPSLEQTIEFWKNRPPGGDAQTLRSNLITSSSTGVDLGAIASSLSSTIGSLGDALERMSSSASLQYSQLGRSSFQKVYVAFAGNSDICLSLLRNCANYGKMVFTWCFPSIASPTSSCVGAAYDIRERITELRSEVTGVSVKSLETLEGMGDIGAPVRGLGTHPSHGLSALSTGTGTPPTHYASHALHDSTLHSLTVSRATDKDPPKLVTKITPPSGEPQGLQSMVGLEDGQRILGQDDILPRHRRECLLHLTRLPLKDKVLVLLSIYAIIIVAIISLALGLFQDFGTAHPPGIPQ